MIFVISPRYVRDAWVAPFQECWCEAANCAGYTALGREAEGQAAIRDELLYMGEAAKLLRLKFTKTLPLCGFADAIASAEARTGIDFRKLTMARLSELTAWPPSLPSLTPTVTPTA